MNTAQTIPASLVTTQQPSREPSGFTGHLVCQATGALNDNLFRQAFAFAITVVVTSTIADPILADTSANNTKAFLGLLFVLPFLLLAPIAGRMADRVPKHLIIRRVRLAELGLCVLGGLALWLQSIPLMLAMIAMLGIQSALFAPVKYSVIPELVPPQHIERANGLLQAFSNGAILLGTAFALTTDPWILENSPFNLLAGAPLLTLCALAWASVGVIAAYRIPALAAGEPDESHTTRGVIGPLIDLLKALNSQAGLWVPAIFLAAVWALGAIVQTVLTSVAVQVFQFTEFGAAMLALPMVIGLAVGALIAPRLILRSYPGGLPVVGGLIATASAVLAGYTACAASLPGFAIALTLIGIGGGMWTVPLNILLQQRSDQASRGRVFAATSVLTTLGLVAGFILMPLTSLVVTLSSGEFLAWSGLLGLGVALGCALHYRIHLTAWAAGLLLRIGYRATVVGAENIPKEGGCVIVANHLSFVDGLLLFAELPRPAHYLVYKRYVSMPILGFILRAGGAIPIDGDGGRRALVASIDAAVDAAKEGKVVVIFPEGKISRNGHLDRFRGGMERIAQRAGVPIIPVHLAGLHGTPFSRAQNKLKPRLRRPVRMQIGEQLPEHAKAQDARNAVIALSYESAQQEADADTRTLGAAFLKQARRSPRALAIADAQGELSRIKLAGIALSLIPLLELEDDEQRVGVLLPTGRAGAIANCAIACAGRTAVNLNHTVGDAGLAQMGEIAELRTVITSRLYRRKIGEPQLPGRVIEVEDLLPKIGKLSVIANMLKVLVLPAHRLVRGDPADAAVLVFSSGSTGAPKGVQLTHRQILANCDAVMRHMELRPGEDCVLNPLPLFHSFGLIPGTRLGLVTGLRVVGHPDPTDGKKIGELAAQYDASFLISTPTFVRGYQRRVEPEQFAKLRFAMVGAEKCPADLRASFRERYGAELYEGYGCTELAPVVACNAPDVTGPDGVTACREGSVGRPLPGIEVITIDPESGEILPDGETGLVVVRSPARMLGYLKRDDLTDAAFVHGGYNTGDMGYLDAEGFLHITGRLARFAKVGGEMVPLENVQEALQQALAERAPESDATLAVSAVPDRSRGERLVVLHTRLPISADELIADLNLPPLFVPKARDFHQVDAIPVLGTGKLDLKGLKQLAEELAAS